jgi:hypothetical protein
MKHAVAILFLLLPASVLTPGQQATQQAATAQIEGAVSSAVDGHLLARARIFLRRTGQTDAYVTWTNADDDGHFLFRSVDDGTYEVAAEKAGFFTDPRKTHTQTLDVKAGDRISGVVIRLTPLAAVRGRIVNEHGDPLQEVQVRLLANEYLHGREFLNPAGLATTDDQGEYRIFGVQPGNYYLVVEYDVKKAHTNPFPGIPLKDAPLELSYPPLFYPFTSDLRQAQRVAVAAGAELLFDFAFLPTPSVSMEGRILNGMTGEPAKNPSVAAYWGDRITGITRKVEVNSKGDFKLDGIEPGPYTLIATMSQDGVNYSDFQVVEVGAGGLRDVQLALMPDFSVKGQVRFENAEDKLQNSLPRRVSIEFMPLVKNTGPFRVSAETRIQPGGAAPAKGVLEFAAQLHPGDRYRVSFPNLPENYYLKSLVVDGHEVSPSEVVIGGNGAELTLSVSPAGGQINGIVRDSKGQPAISHVVLAPDVERLTPELVRTVRSDRQGKFVLRGVAPGTYKLYAWEELDLNELLGQLELLKDFEGDCQLVHVDQNGTYAPELKLIAAR